MVRFDHEPTIGVLELGSIARGVDVLDRVLKEASVRVLFARTVSPGKYVLGFTGSVEDVQSSLRIGTEAAGESLLDRLLLPQVHEDVLAVLRPRRQEDIDALGVIETWTVASTIAAADAAAKRAAVRLLWVRLARGLGGRSYVVLTGEVSDVEASVEAGSAPARERGLLVERVVIPRPHAGLVEQLLGHDEEI